MRSQCFFLWEGSVARISVLLECSIREQWVDYGRMRTPAGYVHVIDDETKWDTAFGRNIMIGLMGRPAEDMHRGAKADSVGVQQQAVAAFRKQFEEFDWTKQLE